ncbi:MAG: HAD family phosphatase [Planctomycetota bacterium]
MPPVKAVFYDMDGTITRPNINWPKLKAAMGVPDGVFILEFLDTLSPAERKRREKILLDTEREAAAGAELNPGVREVLDRLRAAGVKQGLVTNNSVRSARTVIKRLKLKFDLVLTRADGPAKPRGDLLHLAVRRLGVAVDETIYVGDGRMDVEAALDAGMRFVLLASSPDAPAWQTTIGSFVDLPPLVGLGS